MDTMPERRATETFDLVSQVVTLRRRGAPRVTVLAAQDQAWTSLHHEPHRDDARLDAALRVAARDLRRPPSPGSAR